MAVAPAQEADTVENYLERVGAARTAAMRAVRADMSAEEARELAETIDEQLARSERVTVAGGQLVIVDNRSTGITMQPLVNICGFHSFNQVFFEDVRVPKKNIVGEADRGWYYVMLALDFERLVVAIGAFRRTFEELVKYSRETKPGGAPLSDDPLIRDRLAEIAVKIEVAYTFFWQTAWMLDRGLVPNIEASVLKLFTTELSRDLAYTGMEIMGPYAPLDWSSANAPLGGRVCNGYLDCISALVGAGTSEIQRNIIAMRGLGLPWKSLQSN